MLHSERFVDKAPEAIVAILLEEVRWVCSVRTMYRVLAEEVRRRLDVGSGRPQGTTS